MKIGLTALLIVIMTLMLAVVAPAQTAPQRSVAVTFDDLPQGGATLPLDQLQAMTKKLLQSINSNHVPAIGFVNEKKLTIVDEVESRTAILQLWLDAGLELGNHTYSHPYFYNMPLEKFEADLIAGEPVTKNLLSKKGLKLRYFRHPFLNTGPDLKTKTEFEKFLTERGYRVAPVTIDSMEWLFAKVYSEAKSKGDSELMAKIASGYLEYMTEVFQFYEQLSITVVGREIPQVLLLHANQLNAELFDQLAAMIKHRGYRFVSLDEALSDPAYQMPDSYTGKVGISWLQRWAITKGQPFRKEPYLPEIMRQFDNSEATGSDFKTDRK